MKKIALITMVILLIDQLHKILHGQYNVGILRMSMGQYRGCGEGVRYRGFDAAVVVGRVAEGRAGTPACIHT